VQALLEAGAAINIKDNVGVFSLFLAEHTFQISTLFFDLCQSSYLEVTVVPSPLQRSGSTALIEAVERNHDGVVQALLEAGADINVTNHVSARFWTHSLFFFFFSFFSLQ